MSPYISSLDSGPAHHKRSLRWSNATWSLLARLTCQRSTTLRKWSTIAMVRRSLLMTPTRTEWFKILPGEIEDVSFIPPRAHKECVNGYKWLSVVSEGKGWFQDDLKSSLMIFFIVTVTAECRWGSSLWQNILVSQLAFSAFQIHVFGNNWGSDSSRQRTCNFEFQFLVWKMLSNEIV